jgi:hypothetical protein
MNVNELNLKGFLALMLDTDLEAERIVEFAMSAFHVSHSRVSALWNNMLCAKHGI